MNDKMMEALNKVVADLKAMSPEEFKAALEEAKNSDIACAYRELSEFEEYLQRQYGE